jgi:hypothetical protein
MSYQDAYSYVNTFRYTAFDAPRALLYNQVDGPPSHPMQTPIPRQAVRPHPDVIWREVDGEVVLLNVATGQYFGLDAVGSQVWILLQSMGPQGANLESLCSLVQSHFEVDPATAERDLAALLDDLIAQQLLVVA